MKNIILPLFFITFFLGLLNNNPNYSFGWIFAVISIIIIFSALVKKEIIIDKNILILFSLMLFYPLVFLIYYDFFYHTFNFRYLYLLFQILLIFLFFHIGLQLSKYRDYIGYLTLTTILFLVVFSVFFGKSSIVGKENIYASLLLILCAFTLSISINSGLKLTAFFFSSMGILFSDARSSLISLVVLIIFYMFYGFFNRQKTLMFFSIFSASILWIFFIVYLYTTGEGDIYNLVVYELTGKQLYSGRERMWGDFIAAIGDSPIFGYGLGVDYSAMADIEYSTHNLYLAIMLQQGMLGLFLFIILLYVIYKRSENFIGVNGKSFSFLIIPTILIQQNFELSLTQNNMSIMLIFWFLLGVGYYSPSRNDL